MFVSDWPIMEVSLIIQSTFYSIRAFFGNEKIRNLFYSLLILRPLQDAFLMIQSTYDSIRAFFSNEFVRFVILWPLQEASLMIQSTFDSIRVFLANENVRNYLLLPLLDLFPRTLFVDPIIALANIIVSMYLTAYAFFTNKAIKYYLLITYLMPVIDFF